MRDAILNLARRKVPDHVGLAYDVWAPATDEGRVPDDERRDWLEAIANVQVSAGYRHAFECWKASLTDNLTETVEVTLASRLLVGHGNPAPTEVGLTVHHTWGVPIIPGSALKGLCAHYVDTVHGPDQEDRSRPNPTDERARWQGVSWEGNRITHGPGEVYKVLFGAPDADSDDEEAGDGAAQGFLMFHDALFVPGTCGKRDEQGNPIDWPFEPDVLTVHQREYYNEKGGSGPNDYDSPNPVAFLTVAPGAGFLIAVSGPDEWRELGLRLLLEALEHWGVGGKTSSGYGRIERPQPINRGETETRSGGAEPSQPEPTAPPAETPPSLKLQEFQQWAAERAPGLTQRDIVEVVKSEWLAELRSLRPAEREMVGDLLRGLLSSNSRRRDLAGLLGALNLPG